MFAPRIAAPKSPTFHQTISDRVALPPTKQRSTMTNHKPDAQWNGDDAAGLAGREATHSWNFSKIPVFAPTRDERPQFSPSAPSQRGSIQAKLQVNSSHDFQAGHPLQRLFGNHYIAREAASARRDRDPIEITHEIQSAIEGKRGGGQPLDDRTRHRMESSFGADFSPVRVHADTDAGVLSLAISAVAFTTGKDLFFGPGAYNPDSSPGRELLAHELTHVVQQSGGAAPSRLVLGEPGDRYEQEADALAKMVAVTPGYLEGEQAGRPPSMAIMPGSRRSLFLACRVRRLARCNEIQSSPIRPKLNRPRPSRPKPNRPTPSRPRLSRPVPSRSTHGLANFPRPALLQGPAEQVNTVLTSRFRLHRTRLWTLKRSHLCKPLSLIEAALLAI
jgi:hypothetical protein